MRQVPASELGNDPRYWAAIEGAGAAAKSRRRRAEAGILKNLFGNFGQSCVRQECMGKFYSPQPVAGLSSNIKMECSN
jgi:hypothetical protein